jgi:hypothetical protein
MFQAVVVSYLDGYETGPRTYRKEQFDQTITNGLDEPPSDAEETEIRMRTLR